MTDKLYLWSSALSAEAEIVALLDGDRKIVRLSRTVFHPQGGGQRADKGTIAGLPVLDVRHADGGAVDHIVSSLDGLAVGETVRLEVDQATRRLHARLHSAGHLIADAGAMVAPRLVAKAGHHWPNEARVEFAGSVDDGAAFTRVLGARLDTLIAEDRPLVIAADAAGIRTARICGEPVPCGGTHVATLGEIGPITIRRVQQKGGMVRVSYGVSGERG